MTLHGGGYFLDSRAALEDLDMGGGSVLSLKVTSEQSNGQLTVLEGVVQAGGPPLHVHTAEDEVVIVLSGELTYRVGDQAGTANEGGLLWFPRSVPHAVANLTDSPCRFLTVVTPGGIEDFFRAQRDYLASVPKGALADPAALASVPGADTRTVVGPPLTPTLGEPPAVP
jgi:quercetin dioxygenase-like cupin family protein